jgi:DNA-binding response OmpR family regulator
MAAPSVWWLAFAVRQSPDDDLERALRYGKTAAAKRLQAGLRLSGGGVLVARILVIEDEADLNALLQRELTAEGHLVGKAFDGGTALAMVEREVPDLVILDWMLPDLDGLAVCRRLRERHVMPIIMLTARSDEVDRVLGLEVGADDYVTKPFSLRELLARVRAALRRIDLDTAGTAGAGAGEELDAEEPAVQVGPLTVDPTRHEAMLDREPLKLTRTEFQLLHLLVRNPGRAFSRDYLLRRLWSGDYEGLDRTVDTHVAHLRRKLGPFGETITTVWGVGYRFEKPADA